MAKKGEPAAEEGRKEQADILARFGERVRQLRQAKGLSQKDFADACDLDRTYISGIERGRRNVSLRNLQSIARALDMTLAQLFEGLS